MSTRHWFLAAACAALAGAGPALAREDVKPPTEPASFTLKAPGLEAARAQALDWLKATGKADATDLKAFEALWAEQPERPVLDRVAGTFALGDPEAARLLTEAADPAAPAPLAIPALLKDESRPAFFRANLGLAYSRALSRRRVYEESLAVLRLVRPEQVVDPATYFFHRAVAEHALGLKSEAGRSITGVLEDVAGAPERYKVASVLMAYDMKGWKDKDLGDIARKMDNIERRLDLSRGGPRTQKMQKDVIARLDELIKKLENQQKGSSASNGGACPDGRQPGGGAVPIGGLPNRPMEDSILPDQRGAGKVDEKRLTGLAREWGKLPESERAKIMLELTRDMPPSHREVIENYIKRISQSMPNTP